MFYLVSTCLRDGQMAERSGGARPADKGSCPKCGQTVDKSAACPRCERQPTEDNSRSQREDTRGAHDNIHTQKQLGNDGMPATGQPMTPLPNETAPERDQDLLTAGHQDKKRGFNTWVQPDGTNLGEDGRGPWGTDNGIQMAPTSGQGGQRNSGPVVLQGGN